MIRANSEQTTRKKRTRGNCRVSRDERPVFLLALVKKLREKAASHLVHLLRRADDVCRDNRQQLGRSKHEMVRVVLRERSSAYEADFPGHNSGKQSANLGSIFGSSVGNTAFE